MRQRNSEFDFEQPTARQAGNADCGSRVSACVAEDFVQ
jgi:hypothetical protein